MYKLKHFYKCGEGVYRADAFMDVWWFQARKNERGLWDLSRCDEVYEADTPTVKHRTIARDIANMETVETAALALKIPLEPKDRRYLIESGDWALRFLRQEGPGMWVVDRQEGGQYIAVQSGVHWKVIDSRTKQELNYKRAPKTLQECETVILDTGDVLLIGGPYESEYAPGAVDKTTRKKRMKEAAKLAARVKHAAH